MYALKARGTGKPGPAEEAGIRVNDIVVSINDTEGINSTEQVCVSLTSIDCTARGIHHLCSTAQVSRLTRVGDECKMVVYRDFDPVRRRVICFYQEHDPSKLEDIGFVDQVVTNYASEGEILFSRLVNQYGPEPAKELDADKDNEAPGRSDATVSSKMRVLGGGVSSDTRVSAEADVAMKPTTAMALSEQQSLPALAGAIDIRSRLVRFYEIYNPNQLEEVGFLNKMLETHASEGEKMFSRLVKQYGPEPTKQSGADEVSEPAVGSSDAAVSSQMRAADGGVSSGITETDVALKPLAATALSEQQSLPALADAIDIRSRLVRFYEIYNPSQLEEVGFLDKMLETHASEGGELFSRLVEQYGPEPDLQPVSDGGGSTPMGASPAEDEPAIAVAKKNNIARASAVSADTGISVQKPNIVPHGAKDGNVDVEEGDRSAKMRRRLEVFYAAYNPAKLEGVDFMDNILQTHAGKEEMLFARLVKQYGPEPAVSADDSEPVAGSLLSLFSGGRNPYQEALHSRECA